MGNRLSKIYTRTGDDGTTGLGDGSRIDKDSVRVDAFGTVDEANSAIGVVLAVSSVSDDIRACLINVQHDLFELGGELCIPGHSAITKDYVDRLESDLDDFNGESAIGFWNFCLGDRAVGDTGFIHDVTLTVTEDGGCVFKTVINNPLSRPGDLLSVDVDVRHNNPRTVRVAVFLEIQSDEGKVLYRRDSRRITFHQYDEYLSLLARLGLDEVIILELP